tara:strand:- start:2246 stop:2518 length:273 start_codon:yes stop_codon:yes gene_type:complete
MTCHSNKPIIKYLHARVAFKKRKVVHERVEWIVTVFDTPSDIMRYDSKTMKRLRDKYFTLKTKNKDIIIREILDVVELTRSQVTLDEHKR